MDSQTASLIGEGGSEKVRLYCQVCLIVPAGAVRRRVSGFLYRYLNRGYYLVKNLKERGEASVVQQGTPDCLRRWQLSCTRGIEFRDRMGSRLLSTCAHRVAFVGLHHPLYRLRSRCARIFSLLKVATNGTFLSVKTSTISYSRTTCCQSQIVVEQEERVRINLEVASYPSK